MQMTDKEQQEYDKLSQSEKEYFDCQSRKHPKWSFMQVMVKVKFDNCVDIE